MNNPRLSVIPAGAVTDPQLEGRDLQVLALLGRHIDTDNGWCRRSQVKMAREIGCARSTVQASLNRLVAAGWVMTRIEMRAGGGDTAHSYRVILDRDDMPGTVESDSNQAESEPETAEGGADLSAGVPTQERQGVPIHASAPLTSLVERERESAREVSKAGEPPPAAEAGLSVDEAFAALGKVWPAFAAQNGTLAVRAISALTASERQLAVERVPAFLAFHRDTQGKRPLPYLHNYVGQKHRWQALPQAKSAVVAQGEHRFVGSFDRAWWWLYFDAIERLGGALGDWKSSESVWLRDQVARARKNLGWRIAAARLEEVEAAGLRLVQIPVDGREFAAWAAALRSRGADLPRPDKAGWIFVPSRDPPDMRERDAAIRDAADVVMGEGR